MNSDFNLAGDDVAAARESMQRELRDGERLLWVGRATRFHLGASAYLPVLFGLFFTGFAVFWVSMASMGVASSKNRGGPMWLFPLFGVPFILVGLGVMSTPLQARRKASKNVYAITDQRAIVMTGKLFGSETEVRSFKPDQLKAMRRVQRSDGSGDLVFEDQLNLSGLGNSGVGWKNYSNSGQNGPWMKAIGFIGIESVREVETTLRDALRLDEANQNNESAEREA